MIACIWPVGWPDLRRDDEFCGVRWVAGYHLDMAYLPNVTIKYNGNQLLSLFKDYVDPDVNLTNEAHEFIATFDLEGQVTPEQLVAAYKATKD